MKARPGVTVVECLVALALGGLVSAAVGSVLMTQNRLMRGMGALAADTDARRITASVLRAELQWIDPRRDVRSVAGDSIAVRLYRGGGGVCAVAPGRLLVRYSGARLPAPDKDSVLVRAGAAEFVYALTSFDGDASCSGDPAGKPALWLRLDTIPAAASHVLVFESGTYYVRDGALRYRIGRAGRQPITDERFASRTPAILLDGERATAAVPLAWPATSHRAREVLRIHFANVQP